MSLIAAGTWALPHTARACSCLPPPAPAVARDQADAVFEARIDGVTAGDAFGTVRYDLAVQRVFKGEVPRSTALVTNASSAACGRSFVVGKRYLIYAYRGSEGDLRDSLCSRTRLINTADEDLAVLGAGTAPAAPPAVDTQNREPPRIEPPAPPILDAPAPATRRGCDLAGAGAPGLVALLALARRRRR